MNSEDAQNRLNLARQGQRRSARWGAFGTAAVTAVLVIALGVVIDLDMLWLLGLVVLGFVGLSVARPLQLHLNWSDRIGVLLLVASGFAVGAAYLLTQFLTRSSEWGAPNTLSALVAAFVIFVACMPALVRLATPGAPISRQTRPGDA